MKLLHALFCALLITAGLGSAAPLQSRLTVKDIRGRSVSLPNVGRRLLIDDGRYLVALSLIHPDPVSLLAGWPRDINRIGEKTYGRYRQKFPRIADIPQVASSASSFSLEKALAVKPDVAIFTLGLGPSDEQVRLMEAAGIPVVFLDFFSQPFENLNNSLLILGKLTGREAQAQAFVTLRDTHFKKISDRLKASATASRPKVFLEAHAGISEDCCNSPGKGNTGDYLTFVGGHNIAADILPGPTGKVSIEYVISQNPRVYVATGGPHLEKTGGLVLGEGFPVQRQRASLAVMAARPGIAQLSAVREGRAYGLSHQLLNSPLDILAVEVLAKWIRPDLFQDIDPANTMNEINTKFLAVPIEGTHWITLR